MQKGETRPLDQLREHYEIEKELAGRLKNAGKEERSHLYTELYDELFKRVPHHPQLTTRVGSVSRTQSILPSLKLLKNFLKSDSTYLEIGPGDCALALEISKYVKKVYAVDVSKEITGYSDYPENFELIISDGCSIPVPPNSVDLAYSDQLMEHLHPDDALEQLKNIYTALAPAGKYICITPNRICGPHDISMYFDDVATGFHMKEYTIVELSRLLKAVGFSKIERFIKFKGVSVVLPLYPADWIESLLLKLPRSVGKKLSRFLVFKVLLGGLDVKIIATK